MCLMLHRVFVGHHEGVRVLDLLDQKFRAQQVWAPGGIEGQRETDRRAAHKEVIDFIYVCIADAEEGFRRYAD